jgi:hypothetical protein
LWFAPSRPLQYSRNGADVTVKDSKRFTNTGSWGYFNFNHHEPKAPTAKVKDKSECAFCHIAGAKRDEVTLKGWFVPMRDSKNSYPGNKLWGNGWGWSWFDAAKPSKTTSTDYKVDCLPCHEPARATDWIYVQGYPALKQ